MTKKMLLIFFFMPAFISAQIKQQGVNLSVSIKEVDSQYLFVPALKILPGVKGIKIHKRLSYGNENSDADCKFYLQKLIGRFYVNLYTTNFGQPLVDDDFYLLREYTSKDTLSDSIDLDTYIPLEIGEYRIYIELEYYINNEKKTATSGFTEFFVTHRPKRSIAFPKD